MTALAASLLLRTKHLHSLQSSKEDTERGTEGMTEHESGLVCVMVSLSLS